MKTRIPFAYLVATTFLSTVGVGLVVGAGCGTVTLSPNDEDGSTGSHPDLSGVPPNPDMTFLACRQDGDCLIPGPCQLCSDGSCASFKARCVQGACHIDPPVCPNGCVKDSDCPQPPGICQMCADGTTQCDRAVCEKGQCGIVTPTCNKPQCKTSMDCPQSGIPCTVCADGSVACPITSCNMGVCQLSFSTCPSPPVCKVDADCPPTMQCQQCPDGTCAAQACIKGICGPQCASPSPGYCGKVQCPAGQSCCNETCSTCVPFGAVCNQLACQQTAVSGACIRSSGDRCMSDAECQRGGCGGELCYNPKLSAGITTCNCMAPQGLGCGCINGACSWWK